MYIHTLPRYITTLDVCQSNLEPTLRLTIDPDKFNVDSINIDTKLLKDIDTESIWDLVNDKNSQSWYNDSHMVLNFKHLKQYDIYNKLYNLVSQRYDIVISGSILNIYNDTNDWIQFHNDHYTNDQNYTICISFGTTRDIQFKDDDTMVSFSLKDKCVYAFSKIINDKWKHGVQPQKEYSPCKRLSLVFWGLIN